MTLTEKISRVLPKYSLPKVNSFPAFVDMALTWPKNGTGYGGDLGALGYSAGEMVNLHSLQPTQRAAVVARAGTRLSVAADMAGSLMDACRGEPVNAEADQRPTFV